MKILILTVTYVIGISQLAVAVFFWITRSGSEVRKVMSLVAFSASLWVITSAITSYVPDPAGVKQPVAFVYFFGAVLVTSLLHFVLVFPLPIQQINKLSVSLLYLPVVIFSYILFFTKYIVAGYESSNYWAGRVITGPLFGLFNIFFFVVFFSTLFVCFWRSFIAPGIQPRVQKSFFWSLVLGGVPAAILFFLVATTTPELQINTLVGVIPTGLWVATTAWIAIRNRP